MKIPQRVSEALRGTILNCTTSGQCFVSTKTFVKAQDSSGLPYEPSQTFSRRCIRLGLWRIELVLTTIVTIFDKDVEYIITNRMILRRGVRANI